MIIELGLIIICEIIVLLGILIVYCADYTNSYIHCHCPTEPCYDKIKIVDYYCPEGRKCLDDDEFKELVKEMFEDD